MDKMKNYLDSVQQESENLCDIIREGLEIQDRIVKAPKILTVEEARQELMKWRC